MAYICRISSTKSLGVHIDENLSWNVHIETIAKKIARGLGALKCPWHEIIILFERAFKMMKNGVYFTVIALLVAELFKILIYAN